MNHDKPRAADPLSPQPTTPPRDRPLDAHSHPAGGTPGDAALDQAGAHPFGRAAGVVGGAMAGAVIGIAAGPIGSLAGAVAGAIAGGAAAGEEVADEPFPRPGTPRNRRSTDLRPAAANDELRGLTRGERPSSANDLDDRPDRDDGTLDPLAS